MLLNKKKNIPGNKNLRFKEDNHSIENSEDQLFSYIQNSNKELKSQKILCIFQRTSAKEKVFGVSHTEINPQNKSHVIFTGDFPLQNVDIFPLFILDIQPDVILFHSPNNSFLNEFFSQSDALKNKVREMPNINVQYKSLQQLLQNYFQISCNLSQVYAFTKVSDILSNLSSSSHNALYTIINLVLKMKNSEDNKYYGEQIKFEKIFFEEILFVSHKTQKELKVFEEKIHPSFVKGQGKGKEGLSLFNMFNKCLTSQGKNLMGNFFKFPLKNEDKIKERYECINDFAKIKNYAFIKSLTKELQNIKDLEVISNELQKFIVNFRIWENIFISFNSIIKILEIFKTKNFEIKYLDSLFKQVKYESINSIIFFITNCLEFGKDNIKAKIKPGVNQLLDQLKTEFGGLDELLSKLAHEYSNKIPKDCFMEKFMYVFIPQLGYMFAVEKNKKYYDAAAEVYKSILKEKEGNYLQENQLENSNNQNMVNSSSHNNLDSSFSSSNKGINKCQNKLGMTEIIEEEENVLSPEKVKKENSQSISNDEVQGIQIDNELIKEEDDDFIDFQNFEETLILQRMTFPELGLQFQFHSNELIYYKNSITSQLDRDYGDLSARITDVENAIYREISKQILQYHEDIKKVNNFIAQLDVFIQFYLFSEKYTLYPPVISPVISLAEDNSLIKSELSFKEGRNLLTEMINEEKYIKSMFKSNSKSIFIISGNISSGKSVFIRMIGILIYLAQIGSYVPAKNFCFEIFNKLLTNIEITESFIEHMSGFTIELKEIKEILELFEKDFCPQNLNDENILILLDNPFKRTSFHNQQSLLCGTIDYLCKMIKHANKNKKCKIFITVSNELKDCIIRNKVADPLIVDFYEMAYIIQDKSIFNLYEIKKDDAENREIEQNNGQGKRLFLAKENGLNNMIFLKAFEMMNIFSQKKQIFPNVDKICKMSSSLAISKKEIVKCIEGYCNMSLDQKDNYNSELDAINMLSRVLN